MMELSVLLVEDDLDLAHTIIDFLMLESITCDHVAKGSGVEHLVTRNAYDVILLDVNLPSKNGLNVCRELRQQGIDVPVLMLTARAALMDKLDGFGAGSDDYLVKPFELLELVARIHVLAKRRSGQAQQLQVADLTMSFQKHQAYRENRLLKLSPIGWVLLETLMRASPQPVPKAVLIKAIWGEESPDSNSFKVHLHHLRKEVDGDAQPLIHTLPNFGLVLCALEVEA